MIWMLDTNILVYFTNRKPGFEKIARRMSGRTPGEVRLSAITLAELRFGIARGEFRPIDVNTMTQVLVAPMLTLIIWKHSVGPCPRAELEPLAFLDTFLDMALHGLLPATPAV